jgi:GTP pyrophosphokinase
MLDRRQFCLKYPGVAEAARDKSFNWLTLRAIHDDYVEARKNLEPFMESLIARFSKIDGVHSLKSRLKEPEHVIEKILRRGWCRLTLRTYRRRMSDLVGVRIMHLYKNDWVKIHDYIMQEMVTRGRPVANVRAGDSEDLIGALKERGCMIKRHRFGYRSIHYVIVSQLAREEMLAEIQVRTIFEEGWSEIDHGIRYPYDIENPLLGKYLVIFNRLAGSADEMGTFIRLLKDEQEEQSRRLRSMQERVKTLSRQLRVLSKTKVSRAEAVVSAVPSKSLHEGLQQQLNESVRLAEDIRALQDAFLGMGGGSPT